MSSTSETDATATLSLADSSVSASAGAAPKEEPSNLRQELLKSFGKFLYIHQECDRLRYNARSHS